jgi:hypothetical protein
MANPTQDWAMAATSRLMLLQDDEKVANLLHRAYKLGIVHALCRIKGWDEVDGRSVATFLDAQSFYLEEEMP